MGLLDYPSGLGAQAFTDNFLKTYMAIGEERRAEEAQKMKKTMQEATIQEMQRQQVLRDAQMREINAQAAQREAALQRQNAMQTDFTKLQDDQASRYIQGMINADPRLKNGLLTYDPSTRDMANLLYKYNPEQAATVSAQMDNRDATLALKEQQLRESERHNKAIEALKGMIAAHNDNYNKEERDIVKPLFSNMPALQKTARESLPKIEQYKQLSSMLDRGAGGVEGALKAAVAPIAEYLGVDSKGMSEAQAYQLIARAGAGAMRLQLIGPGQVSEYEQKLMQKLSGGDIRTSREAAKDLFAFYSNQSKQNIKNYNDSVDSLVGAGYKRVGDVYKKIDVGSSAASTRTVVEQRRTQDGRILTKYSDGSIE